MKETVNMEFLAVDDLEDLIKICPTVIGDIALKSMGYIDVRCELVIECEGGGSYNICWKTTDGNEWIKTFDIEDILDSFKGKMMDLEINIRES